MKSGGFECQRQLKWRASVCLKCNTTQSHLADLQAQGCRGRHCPPYRNRIHLRRDVHRINRYLPSPRAASLDPPIRRCGDVK
eukprot:scaffold49887_cov33-Tisochrysis_lutea.AAC.4